MRRGDRRWPISRAYSLATTSQTSCTVSSFFVHRKITDRFYDHSGETRRHVEPAPGPPDFAVLGAWAESAAGLRSCDV